MKKFRYCSFAPNVRVCKPVSDGISSTEHLLVYPALRLSVWIVSIMTLSGNFLVLTWRVLSHREDKVLSLFIKNLAFADLLMGVYLLAIGAKDYSFRDMYNSFSHAWVISWECSFLGGLAMVSTEVTIMILSVITIERHRCIRTNVRVISVSGARNCCGVIWTIGFFLAIMPVFKYSKDQGFYSSNGLCFPLFIDDPFTLGYQYSAFLFFGINFSAVMVIIFLYTHMFLTIKRDRQSARPVSVQTNEDAVLAIRVFFIVVTGSLCVLPIVIIKLVALLGIPISRNLYALVCVFIVPINSALDPILYTISAPTGVKRIQKLLVRLSIWLQRFDCIIKSSATKTSTLTRSVTTVESRFLPSSNVTHGELDLCITTI